MSLYQRCLEGGEEGLRREQREEEREREEVYGSHFTFFPTVVSFVCSVLLKMMMLSLFLVTLSTTIPNIVTMPYWRNSELIILR